VLHRLAKENTKHKNNLIYKARLLIVLLLNCYKFNKKNRRKSNKKILEVLVNKKQIFFLNLRICFCLSFKFRGALEIRVFQQEKNSFLNPLLFFFLVLFLILSQINFFNIKNK